MARSGTSGLGRPKGGPNKINADVRRMILNALEAAGGERYLTRCALENQPAFLTLLGRILPSQLEHSGAVAMDGEAIDRPPPESREQWIQRRQRELAAQRQTLATTEPAGSAD